MMLFKTCKTALVRLSSLFLLVLVAVQCERDPDLAERELFIYLSTCPGSISQCQSECLTSADVSNNGIIEGAEEQLYNVCISNCQNACLQPFLFYLLTDEGN